jgi:PAS domain S-box-containing protein
MVGAVVLLVGTDFAVPHGTTPRDWAGTLDDAFPDVEVDFVERPADVPADRVPPDCVLNGVAFDDGALDFLGDLRVRYDDVPVVHLAATPDESIPASAFDAGLTDCLCLTSETDPAAALATAVRDAAPVDADPFASGTGVGSEFPVGTAGQFHYRDLVEHLPDPVFVLATDGTIRFVNDAIASLTGYEPTDLVGQDVSVLVAPSDEAAGEDADWPRTGLLDDERATGTVEVNLRTADGETIPTETHLAMLPPDDGVPFRGTVAVVRDITERTEARARLRAAEQRYRRLVEQNLFGIYIVQDGRIEYANPRAAELFGYDPDEMVDGMTVFDMVASEDHERLARNIRRRERGEETELQYELTGVRSDGTEFEFEVHSGLIVYEGEPALLGALVDITDRKERERELTQYETIVETVPDAVFVTDGDDVIVGGNANFADLLGLDFEDVVGTPADELVAEGRFGGTLRDEIRRVVPDLLAADDPDAEARVEFDALPDVADEHLVCEARVALRPHDDEYRGIIGVVRDITERKERIEELERYETLVQTVPDSVYALDADGHLDLHNQACLDQYGLTAAAVDREDVHFSEFVADGDVDRLLEATRRLLSDRYDTDGKAVVECTAVSATGRQFPIENHFTPLYDQDGDLRGITGIARDITEREQRRERLQVLNRVLRHNLRNELGVMIAATDALADHLREEYDDPDNARMAHDAAEAGRALLDISDEVRRIQSALERDRVEMLAVDATEIVTGVVESLQAEHPDATVRLDLPDAAPVEAGEALELAVEHVVENALVHTGDSPTVTVTVERDETDRGDWYEIRVDDDGPGIPEQERVVVEETEDITPLKHGSSLGLWAVTWIVQSYDGAVDIETSDEGSVVSLRIHAAP